MKKTLILLTLCLGSLTPAWGADLAVVLGYPYLAVKYNVVPAASLEAKYAFGEGVAVLAGRGYWNFYQEKMLGAFAGLELGHVGFNTLGMEGQGVEAGAFVGGTYEFMPAFGLTLDIGPSMIQLSSQDTNTSGLEWVVTAGIYWNLF